MGNIKKVGQHGPEWFIQRAVKEYLRDRGWMVEHTHGSLYQTGFPDLFTAHPTYGSRWIDCKVKGRYTFTRDQKRKWPVWKAAGIGIWIITSANQEQYDLLFGPPNWEAFWKPSWGVIPNIDDLLSEIEE